MSEQTALKKKLLWNAESGKDMTAMGGLKLRFKICTRSFEWEVYMAPIHDTFLLSLDLLRAANVTIHANGRVFIEGELLPDKIVGSDRPDYFVARVLLEKDTTFLPKCECLVWGEVDHPKPGVSTVPEPLSINEAVSSRSVVTTMEQRVPVRLCNLSSNKATLPRGACLGFLVETFTDDPSSPSCPAEQKVPSDQK